jgi:hypothetical protein
MTLISTPMRSLLTISGTCICEYAGTDKGKNLTSSRTIQCHAMQLTQDSNRVTGETNAHVLFRVVHASWSKPSCDLCIGAGTEVMQPLHFIPNAVLPFIAVFTSLRWNNYLRLHAMRGVKKKYFGSQFYSSNTINPSQDPRSASLKP